MPKQAVFTMKLEPENCAMSSWPRPRPRTARRPRSCAADARDSCPRQREAREYDAWPAWQGRSRSRVVRAGQGRTDDEVEAEFAAAAPRSMPSREGHPWTPGRYRIVSTSGTTSLPRAHRRPPGWTRFSRFPADGSPADRPAGDGSWHAGA